MTPQLTEARIAVARALAADALAAEVVPALASAGVRPILLKGASFAAALYEPNEPRGYLDCDLLVAPADVPAAERVLEELGFERPHPGLLLADVAHGLHWKRAGEASFVDLHWELEGVEAPPEAAFAALARRTQPSVVGGVEVDALAPSGIALVAGLHAAQHGSAKPQALRDLERALARLGEATWVDAARLARDVGATAAFAVGLRTVPEGEALARRLGLPHDAPLRVVAQACDAPPTTRGWYLASRLEGTARLRFLLRKLFPHPAFMRSWSSLARRGRTGLVAAYAWRPLWLLPRAARGLTAFARLAAARRRHDRHSLRAAVWTLRALRDARRAIDEAGLADGDLPPVPALPPRAGSGVDAVLRRTRATCMVKASVRQAWLAAQGDPRDLVIGVTAPADGFQAHAWLDGDPESTSGEYSEIARRPAPASVSTR
jgi:Uncharacterised nucleotidyltransferase/Transglutaminase-like superfamily